MLRDRSVVRRGSARWWRALLIGALCFPLLLLSAATAAPIDLESRQRFLAAEAALAAGDEATVRQYLATAGAYPLRPYLERDLLLSQLTLARPTQVRRYLEDHLDEPFVRPLQRAWLRRLSRANAWRDYLVDYSPGLGAEFDCLRLQALMATGQRAQAFDEVPGLWVHGRSRPAACDPAFDAWIDADRLSASQLWDRIEAAFGQGELRLVRYLRSFLAQRDRKIVDVWLAAHREPAATLASGQPDPDLPRSGQIVLHALQRWARFDPGTALDALPKLQLHYDLSDAKVASAARSAALLMAARKEPDARQRMLALPEAAKDERIYEWLARAAMARGDWAEVVTDIARMPDAKRASLQWRYWQARSLEALGRSAEATDLYREIAGQRDYYSFLAAERVGLPYRYGHRPLLIEPALLVELAHDPAIARARELVALGRFAEARSEWNYGLRERDAAAFRAAAQLASDWGWHSAAIFTVARARDWDDLELRFPVSHRDAVMAAASSESLEPQWVFAVMRQESAFQTDAHSSAGAMGLMQLMPATARLVAKTLPKPLQRISDLYRPEVNIPLGTRYLRMSRQNLQDSAVLATAGYNAGPRRVEEWLPENEGAEADIWVETVPYEETRGYLRRVMEYSVIYEHRLGLEGGFLRDQMRSIAPRSTAS